MLIGYFDDSGTHDSTRAVTMAGYLAPDNEWHAFELSAARLFKEYGITLFHAKHFYQGQNQFRGWTPMRQLMFATELFDLATQHARHGVACSVTKDHFDALRKNTGLLPRTSSYGYCLQVVIKKLCADPIIWDDIQENGLALRIESGNANNQNVALEFERIRQENNLEHLLLSVEFVGKTHCRAIQLADYLAYFAWQLANKAAEKRLWERSPLHDIAVDRIRTVGCLAEDFSPNPDYPYRRAKNEAC